MLTPMQIARYFLALTDEDAGDSITNMKIQKLVYYAQGFHLAIYDKPLFLEPIEAWTHGPVIPILYHAFKQHGPESIPTPTDLDFSDYDDQIKDLLNEVYKVYGQFSAWKLRNMTHEEMPWVNATQGDGTISIDDLREYFKTLLVA